MKKKLKALTMLAALAGFGCINQVSAGNAYLYQNSKHPLKISKPDPIAPPCSNQSITQVCRRKETEENLHTMLAHITTYWASGGETDSWSRHHESTSGARLEEGVSVAVDPRIIPLGSTVIIPGMGKRKAQDTGSAVIDKVASHGKMPVIDVFFENKCDALEYAANNPTVVLVSYR